MTLRPLVLTAIVVGLLAGVVAALVIPTTRPGGANAGAGARAASAAAQAGVVNGSDVVLRVAPARKPYGDVEVRPAGPVRIEARARDPLGGPDWAVRVFEAERVVRKGLRRPGASPVAGRPLCAQLGRLHKGTFGWLEADGTFRPLRLGAQNGATSVCGSRRADLHGRPTLSTLSPITEPHAPAARVKATIAWGLAGSAARSVALNVSGRGVAVPRTPHNAYVIALGPEVAQRHVTGSVAYPGRRRVPMTGAHVTPAFGGGGPAGPPLLGARAPDPNGGLPFALMVVRSGGGWCETTGGRVVGDRVGGVDYVRDILTERLFTGGGSCGPGGGQAFEDHPVLLGLSSVGGTAPEEGDDTGGTGRVVRRTQRGTTLLYGPAAPDVVAVTIETPRDVRTLIPSGPTHAVVVAYDGRFPTGTTRVVARFEDGHTVTDVLPQTTP